MFLTIFANWAALQHHCVKMGCALELQRLKCVSPMLLLSEQSKREFIKSTIDIIKQINIREMAI